MLAPKLITPLSAQELINRSDQLILSSVDEETLYLVDIYDFQYSVTLPNAEYFSIYIGGRCPRLDNWSILPNNSLIGYMYNHKHIPDGNMVITRETNIHQHVFADTPNSALFLGQKSGDQLQISEYAVIRSFDISPIRNNKNSLPHSFAVFGVDYNGNQIQVGVFKNLQRAMDFIQLTRSLL